MASRLCDVDNGFVDMNVDDIPAKGHLCQTTIAQMDLRPYGYAFVGGRASRRTRLS